MEWITVHWEFLAAVVSFVVWLTRLEGKTLQSEKRLDRAETQIENLESGLSLELGKVREALARIEGYLKAKSEKQE
jgi:hypothetical protein